MIPSPGQLLAASAVLLFVALFVMRREYRIPLIAGLFAGGLVEMVVAQVYPRELGYTLSGDFLVSAGPVPLSSALLWAVALAGIYVLARDTDFDSLGRASWAALLMFCLILITAPVVRFAGIWSWGMPPEAQLSGVSFATIGLVCLEAFSFLMFAELAAMWRNREEVRLVSGAILGTGFTLWIFPVVFRGAPSDIFAAGLLIGLSAVVVFMEAAFMGESELDLYHPAWLMFAAAAVGGLGLYAHTALSTGQWPTSPLYAVLFGAFGVLVMWVKQHEKFLFNREVRYREREVKAKERSSRSLEEIEGQYRSTDNPGTGRPPPSQPGD